MSEEEYIYQRKTNSRDLVKVYWYSVEDDVVLYRNAYGRAKPWRTMTYAKFCQFFKEQPSKTSEKE